MAVPLVSPARLAQRLRRRSRERFAADELCDLGHTEPPKLHYLWVTEGDRTAPLLLPLTAQARRLKPIKWPFPARDSGGSTLMPFTLLAPTTASVAPRQAQIRPAPPSRFPIPRPDSAVTSPGRHRSCRSLQPNRPRTPDTAAAAAILEVGTHARTLRAVTRRAASRRRRGRVDSLGLRLCAASSRERLGREAGVRGAGFRSGRQVRTLGAARASDRA